MRDYHRRILAFLDDIGAERVRIEKNGHYRIVFDHAGREHVYHCAGTPSDQRSFDNTVSDLRHMLGLVTGEKRVGQRRPARLRPRRRSILYVPKEPPPAVSTGDADWKEILIRGHTRRGTTP